MVCFRLCIRDPHQLYQRLESQGREYVIEMKVRLLKQLTSGHKTPPQAKQFVAMLLEEYSNLCTAAKTLASFLTELVRILGVTILLFFAGLMHNLLFG